MAMYIDMLIDKIDRFSRRGHREFTVFPIEAVNIFESIIKSAPSKALKKKKNGDVFVHDNLYPSEIIPLFLTADRLIFLIFHLNCKFNINLNTKLKYNDTKRDSTYVKYMYLFSDSMSKYNNIDIFLELLKTISSKIYFKKLLYFGLTLFKCLDTLTYLSLQFIDKMIYENYLKEETKDLFKKEKNKEFKVLLENMKNNTNTYKDFDERYENFYKLYYCNSIPECLNVCIILYHFMFKDNYEMKDTINRYNNTSKNNLISEKFIVDKYDETLNILLFYYVNTIRVNNYEDQKKKVISNYDGDSIIYLLKDFLDNYLFLNNNMIESIIYNLYYSL